MSQDRTYAASIEQNGDRRAKRFCKTTSRHIVRTLNIAYTAPHQGSSSIAHGSALGTQIQNTMRPVWATLNKTLIHNANAVNPLKNSGYAVLVVYFRMLI